jgi:serine/arginine repetitive matrix protein 2
MSTFAHDSIFDSSAQTMPDSLFDSTGIRTRDSIFDITKVDEESVFTSTRSALNEKERKFMLKGLRPVSTVSTATSTTVEADERDIISSAKRGYVTCAYDMSPISKGPAACHEAEGEDETMCEFHEPGLPPDLATDASARSLAESTTSGRQVLNSSIVRPAKPRRRPARMPIQSGTASLAPQPETPALSSPSTSETSSRLSLETRFSSDAGSVFSSIGRFGHQRQKSSIQVQRQETIREEPSTATLRGLAASHRSKHHPVKVKGWDDDFEDADEEETPETIRYWNEWKREADAEYRRMKSYGVSSNSLREKQGEGMSLPGPNLIVP